MNWLEKYVKDHKKNANYLVNNKINWHTDQGGYINLRAKDAHDLPIKFRTSKRGKYFVLKSYGTPTRQTFNGVWVHITKKQALVLARELLIYAGEKE